MAHRGTIFLDEVGDLHEASQAKLLRVLQDGEVQRVGGEQAIRVTTRVISATNRRLDDLVADGRFRADLFYRLSVVPIRVPPLRERLEDITDLVPYFLSEFCARNNFRPRAIEPEAIALLARYAWPGNVRELRNVVERMAILSPGDPIRAESIRYWSSAGSPTSRGAMIWLTLATARLTPLPPYSSGSPSRSSSAS